jgi:hypothetical protein
MRVMGGCNDTLHACMKRRSTAHIPLEADI